MDYSFESLFKISDLDFLALMNVLQFYYYLWASIFKRTTKNTKGIYRFLIKDVSSV